MFRRKANPSRREAEPPVGFSFPIDWACLSKDVTSAGARGPAPARPSLVFTAAPQPSILGSELAPVVQISSGPNSSAQEEMVIPEVEIVAPSVIEMQDLALATGQEADDQAQEADAAASDDIRD